MAFCIKCGGEIVEANTSFCPNCGEDISDTQGSSSIKATIDDADYTAFIGKNADKYLPKFKRFNVSGMVKFSATWHWPAFLFGPFWMLYRKLYLWALGASVLEAFLIGMIPHYRLIAMFVWGITGYYLYYRHAKNRILQIKGASPSPDISKMLVQVGGVHAWLLKIYVILVVGVVAALLLSILIPPNLR
jgi:hypothetical protein